jgi:hypothetical protein
VSLGRAPRQPGQRQRPETRRRPRVRRQSTGARRNHASGHRFAWFRSRSKENSTPHPSTHSIWPERAVGRAGKKQRRRRSCGCVAELTSERTRGNGEGEEGAVLTGQAHEGLVTTGSVEGCRSSPVVAVDPNRGPARSMRYGAARLERSSLERVGGAGDPPGLGHQARALRWPRARAADGGDGARPRRIQGREGRSERGERGRSDGGPGEWTGRGSLSPRPTYRAAVASCGRWRRAVHGGGDTEEVGGEGGLGRPLLHGPVNR